ncbi:MAG: heavy-metal-associated domain-containing protein, partial [Gracilibacteraceae bacterium]|nr:heavy-metal-associated domain-containing protein [Gracilibacteraceae bacterium]
MRSEWKNGLASKTLYLQGLDCAFCAQKIEDNLRNLPGVSFVSMDFAGQKLTLSAASEVSWTELLPKVKTLIADTEPAVEISENKQAA